MGLQLFCKFRVAGEQVPQPEDESIDHEGKQIMMRKVEPLGFVEVDKDEACAAEDVEHFDADDAADDIEKFPVSVSGETEDETGVEDEELEAVANVGDIEEAGLTGADSHDRFEAFIPKAFWMNGGNGVKAAGGIEEG
jgi:hypothetical protein